MPDAQKDSQANSSAAFWRRLAI